MTCRGGIYAGPGGNKFHGDGSEVYKRDSSAQPEQGSVLRVCRCCGCGTMNGSTYLCDGCWADLCGGLPQPAQPDSAGKVSGERLKAFANHTRVCYSTGVHSSMAEVESIARELQAAREEIAMLKGAMKAQDERERIAGEKCGVAYELHGCDWPDAIASEFTQLRQSYVDLLKGLVKL